MKLDVEKPIAKYLQIKKSILQYLEDEHYCADQRLPSEKDLMDQFGVSRNTVRQALGELVNQGIIYKKHRSGSFFSGTLQGSQKRSNLIGVIAPYITTYIYPQLIQGINDVAHHHHSNIVFGITKGVLDDELPAIKRLLDKEIDGLLIELCAGFQRIQDSDSVRFLKNIPIPVVFLDWMIDDPDLSYVGVNDFEGGFRATSYLAKAGHRRIACIYPGNHIPGILRYQGYRKALETYGIDYDSRLDKPIPISEWNKDPISRVMQDLIDIGADRPSAVFFFNDELAILGGYPTIRKAGLSIPDDISVIGFDDSDLGIVADVPLTSVVHPKYLVGRWAAKVLFENIDSDRKNPPTQILLTPVIAVRDSVKVFRE